METGREDYQSVFPVDNKNVQDDENLYAAEDFSNDLSNREEDYLLAILESLETNGFARTGDISKLVGVRPASAVDMLRKLDRKKLIIYKKYRGVALTAIGQNIALAVYRRRKTSIKFLELLLLPREIAIRDAHILDHQLDTETIRQLEKFIEFETFTVIDPRYTESWKETFRAFCEESRRS